MTSPFVCLSHRAVLSLQGPDTIALLERLVTHRTDDWATGETRYGALLTPQGKVIADYLALRTTDGVLLDVSADHVDDLAKRLKLFRLRAAVEIEVLNDLCIVAGTRPANDQAESVPGTDHIYLDPRYPGQRVRAFVTKQNLTTVCGEDAADQTASLSPYHADRITAGIAEQGIDFGAAEVFPAEINMDLFDGVALNKGCFVGQEVVSRMHRRGKIRKRTLPVMLSADTSVSVGTDIVAAAPIGTLTSREGQNALARIRVDRFIQAGDSPLTADETPVMIEKPDWLLAEQDAMTPS